MFKPSLASLPRGPGAGLRPLASYARAPYAFFKRCAESYGDPFSMNLPSGRVVMTGNSALVKQIFSASPDLFDAHLADELTPMLGTSSLFLLSGEQHKRERKLLAPPFHGARMRAYAELIRELTLQHCRSWRPGSTLTVQDITHAISLDVILGAVFGVYDSERKAHYRRAITERVSASHPAIMFVKSLRRDFGGFGPWARFQRARERLDALLYADIAARRSAHSTGDDILSLLLSARYEDGGSMSDQAIRDELVTLLIAGHETSATAIAWALYWVLRNPLVEARLRRELHEHPDADLSSNTGLPYLSAVCSETLRLNPIVPDVVRRLKRPWRLGDYDLPAGCGVGVAISLVHEDPALYPEPHSFRPERFLDKSPTPFEYLPFGGGARRCIGAALANYELRVALVTLLRECSFQLVDDVVLPKRRNFTLGPATGVKVVFEGRRAS